MGWMTTVSLGNALVDMYATSNTLAKAQEVLYQHPIGDVVSWNGLISGYVQMGLCEEAYTGSNRCKERRFTKRL